MNSIEKIKNIDLALEDLKAGKMIIVADDEDRENEGDFIIPADTASPEDINFTEATDSWGAISATSDRTIPAGSKNYNIYKFRLYAPIFSDQQKEAIYSSPSDLAKVLDNYIEDQEAAISKYKHSMNIVAANIFNNNASGATGQNTGKDAAIQISDLPLDEYKNIEGNLAVARGLQPSCASIAGKFIFFFSGDKSVNLSTTDGCGTSLSELMKTRWASTDLTSSIYEEFSYALPDGMSKELFSAYRPGPQHDAGAANGVVRNPLNSNETIMIRNFYSTKFIPMKSLTNSSGAAFSPNTLPIFSEGAIDEPSADNETLRDSFKNPIEDTNLSRSKEQLHH